MAPTTKRQLKMSIYGLLFLCNGPYASPGETVLCLNVIFLYIVMYTLLVICDVICTLFLQ